MLWKTQAYDEELAAGFSRKLRVAPVIGRLLAQRGLASIDEAELFLRPRLAHLQDPFELTNMTAAVERIEAAIESGENVIVFGDYDVDGVTSTVQLIAMLRIFGLDPRFCVPRRLDEGYGLSLDAINRAIGEIKPDLFIALDCGTNAHEPIAYLRELGIDVIVVDHHQSKVSAPEGCIFVNPHVNDSPDVPWAELCTAGLVFKLLHGLLKHRREAEDPRAETVQLKDFLDLVSMGTIADLVPLHGENRILSWYGLRHLRANGRAGVRALAEVSGLDSSQDMVSSDVSFRLGPRINASGRLADASLPIELFLCEDYAECRKIAQELDLMNRERQTIERTISEEAQVRVLTEFAEEPGIVLFGADWHPGVVGIVASRVSRQFNKPCVVLGCEGDLAKGSGRSVSDVNLVEVFRRCARLLDHWGGHPMAAGLSLKAVDVPEFQKAFLGALRELYPEGLPARSLHLDCWLEPTDLDELLLEELDLLHPFGQGNAEPVFGMKGVVLEDEPEAFGKGNFRFRIPMGAGRARPVPGIAWRTESAPPAGRPVDMAIRFAWNYWRGNRYPQVTLVDWRESQA